MARRMNAIVMHRNETLDNMTNDIQDMFDEEDKSNFKTKRAVLVNAIDNLARANTIEK